VSVRSVQELEQVATRTLERLKSEHPDLDMVLILASPQLQVYAQSGYLSRRDSLEGLASICKDSALNLIVSAEHDLIVSAEHEDLP
jgi:hypothetical protein